MLVLITSLPIALAQDSHLLELPKGVKARLGKGWVTDMTFSPDGNQLAVATSIGIWLYNINTGKEEAYLKGHTDLVTSVTYSTDGQTLASASNDWTIRLWDVGNRQHIKTLQAHKASVNTVAFSPDGNTLVSGGNDGILLWDIEDWQYRHIFKGKSDSTTSLVYSPDGQTLTSGSRDGKIHLWDTIEGRRTQTFLGHERHVVPEAYAQYLTSLEYSPDGKTLASWSNGKLLLLESVNGMPMKTTDFNKFQVSSFTFSHSGSIIVTGCYDGSIYFWDKDDLTQTRKLQGHVDKVTSVVYSPNSNIYASASIDGTIRLWDSDGEAPKHIITGHTFYTSYVACIEYSPDGSTLASGGMNGDVHLWNAETGQYVQTLGELNDMEKTPKVKNNHSQNGKFKKMVTSIAYAADGKFLAYGTMDNKIHIWDTQNKKHLRMLDPHIDEKHPYTYMDDVRHSHSVYALAYSPDGKILVSGSENGKIRLWNPQRGWWLKTLTEPKKTVTSISFAPDGKTFVSNGDYGKIFMYDVKKKQHIRTLEAMPSARIISSVAYSPKGKTIAAGSTNKMIYLWNAETGVLRQVLSGHTDHVTSVSFSPDGNILASASYDRTIRLWNTETGHYQTTISGQMGRITSVRFSPDGRTLASASSDGTVLIWNLSSIKQETVPEPDKNSKQNISLTPLTEGVKIRFSEGWTNDITYSPDGSHLAIAGNIGTRICNTTTGRQVALFKASIPTEMITYSPDGRMLVCKSRSEIFSIDPMTGKYLYIIPMNNRFNRFVHSPNGSTIATWGNGPIQLWNAETGQQIQTIKASWYSNTLAYSPDGKTIAYNVNQKVQLWNVEKGKHKQTLSGHTHTVQKVIYAPDGKTLASIGKNINGYSSSKDLEVLLWDAKTGNLKHTLTCNRLITTLLYSPNGKTLAGGSSIWIYLWDVSSGKIIHKLNGGTPFKFAPDGRTIAGMKDSTIKLWDTLSGAEVKTLKEHTEEVNLLQYSPDGKTLTTQSGWIGNEICVWDVD